MKFSIVTPVRNMENYVAETIESVVNQKNLDKEDEIEYFIIDGASTDKTLEIIKEYQKKYPFIKLISEKDNSMFEALSKGLKKTSGEVVSYINAGDFFNLYAFSIIKKILIDHKEINWITGSKYIYNENSETIKNHVPYKYRRSLILSGVYGRFLPFIQQESTFWRASLNELIDYDYLSNLKLSGDYYLWFNFSKKYELSIIQTHLGGFRIHENQLSSQKFQDKLTYKDEMKQYIKKINLRTILLILIDTLPWILLKYTNELLGRMSNHLIYNTKIKNYQNTKFKDQTIYCWGCDIGTNRGEGNLSKNYIKNDFSSNSKFLLKTIEDEILINYNEIDNKLPLKKKINLNIFESYFAPIIGIFWLWHKYFLGKKICYLNFLPLWNTFLFLFLPPGTKLGVITGSVYKGKVTNFKSFLRKYAIPFFYIINSKLVLLRSKNLNFSTNLLEKYFSKKNKTQIKFNYIFKSLQFNEFIEKDIDFAIYYREYDTKSNYFFEKLINYFNQSNYKFVYFGNKCKNIEKNYLGYLSNNKVNEILSKTKFSIVSEENYLSFYAIECISNHVNIFLDHHEINYIRSFIQSDKILGIDFNKHNDSISTIDRFLKKYEVLKFPFKKEDIVL